MPPKTRSTTPPAAPKAKTGTSAASPAPPSPKRPSSTTRPNAGKTESSRATTAKSAAPPPPSPKNAKSAAPPPPSPKKASAVRPNASTAGGPASKPVSKASALKAAAQKAAAANPAPSPDAGAGREVPPAKSRNRLDPGALHTTTEIPEASASIASHDPVAEHLVIPSAASSFTSESDGHDTFGTLASPISHADVSANGTTASVTQPASEPLSAWEELETMRREHAEANEHWQEECQSLQKLNAELRARFEEDMDVQRSEVAALRQEARRRRSVDGDLRSCREALEKSEKENAELQEENSELRFARGNSLELRGQVPKCEDLGEEVQHTEMVSLLLASLQDLTSEQERMAIAHNEHVRNVESHLNLRQDWWQSLVGQIRTDIDSLREGANSPNSAEVDHEHFEF